MLLVLTERIELATCLETPLGILRSVHVGKAARPFLYTTAPPGLIT